MEVKSGTPNDTAEKSLKFTFTLNPDNTVVVDWHKKVKTLELPTKKKNPTAGSTSFMSVVQKLEAIHSGLNAQYDYGYAEDDDFIAPEEEPTIDDEDEEIMEDFYVNVGELNPKKRLRDDIELSESDIDDSEEDEVGEALPPLPPEIEEFAKELEEVWNREYPDPEVDRPARIPNIIEPYLLKIAQAAQNTNKQKFIASNVVRRVSDITGFTEGTIRPRLKELVKRAEATGGYLPPPTESSQSITELVRDAYLKVEEEIKKALEGGIDDLKELKNRHVSSVRNLVSKLEVDTIWTQEIRIMLFALSYIEEAYAKTLPSSTNRQVKQAYAAEICSIWPEGKMNKTKLSAHVASYRAKLKRLFESQGVELSSGKTSSSSPVATTATTSATLNSSPKQVPTFLLENLQPPLKFTKSLFSKDEKQANTNEQQ